MAGNTNDMGLRAAKRRRQKNGPTRVTTERGTIRTRPGTGFLRSALRGDVRRRQIEEAGG